MKLHPARSFILPIIVFFVCYPDLLYSQSPSELPTEYGIYYVDGDKTQTIPYVNTVIRAGIALDGVTSRGAYAVDGLSDVYASINISLQNLLRNRELSPSAYFILYFREDPRRLRLARLGYVESMRAHEFNIEGTDRSFFYQIYRKNYNDRVPIEAWRPQEYVRLRIEPVQGYREMYILRPTVSLKPGIYALFFEGHLRNDVFVTTTLETNSIAFPFMVK